MLKKNNQVIVNVLDGKYYAMRNSKLYELNETGARILELCNGENETVDICRKLAKFYSIDESMLRGDIESYIESLATLKLIEVS